MTSEAITASEFQKGVSIAVQAVLNVYRETRTLFEELADALDLGTPRIVHFGPKLVPEGNKESWENRILRSWQGRLYLPADTTDAAGEDPGSDGDDEQEEEEPGGKAEELSWGQSLIFAKATIYSPGETDVVPSLAYGVLSDCHIGAQSWAQDAALMVPRANLKHILSKLSPSTQAGRYETTARVKPPKGKNIKGSNRCLLFTIPEPPRVVPLYDINSHEKVQEVADGILVLWKSVNGA